ncbi:hypothetical protein ASC75_24645 [Aminobacter sp. DSM 101952]|uniref:ArdC-like ssDNA-binding domain-containing protein n=1 Tax=Aminobacter sp. DSM 101952 TaxID=2735891 RepID=UPI0006FD0E12|nr:ArdC-like ssDNA-binding domain-containing protein [Aminobacter sp. DSM 101952]KQU71529.1 hypothetical protein ASC75_24645 [Aminobacter sp. DSM 101952]
MVAARTGSDRANFSDEITDKIVAKLEAGRVPWSSTGAPQPPKSRLACPGTPRLREASGINVIILWGAVIEHGFPGQGMPTQNNVPEELLGRRNGAVSGQSGFRQIGR